MLHIDARTFSRPYLIFRPWYFLFNCVLDADKNVLAAG